MPTSEVLGKLANALDTTVDFLMSGSLNDMADTDISDKELLSQFKRAEHLPQDKKRLVKEFCISPLNTWRKILQMFNFKFVGLWHVKNGQHQKSWQF